MEAETTTTLLTELLKQGPLLTFMGLALYIFYKKDETRRTNDLAEREAMRIKLDLQEVRFETYFKGDNLILQNLVRDNTEAAKNMVVTVAKQTELITDTVNRQTRVIQKATDTMDCVKDSIDNLKSPTWFKSLEIEK